MGDTLEENWIIENKKNEKKRVLEENLSGT